MKKPMKIRPVLLCGGSGSRLWPISTQEYPKQFIEFMDQNSLFEITLKRLKKVKNALSPLIISNEKYRFIIENLLKKNKLKADIILEPEGKNTTAAFYLSSKFSNENEIILFLPSDHFIKHTELFIKCLNTALENYIENKWITFGIYPSFPHDGFGYIQTFKNTKHKNYIPYDVKSFTEKPNKSLAKKFLKTKNYFWNSGIFITSSTVLKQTIRQYEKDIALNCDLAWENKIIQNTNINFDKNIFKKIRSQAIDFTLMNIPKQIQMYLLNVGWNDVGSWDNFLKIYKTTYQPKNYISINSDNNYLYPSSKNIVTIDVENLIVVDNPDSLLICKKGSSEKLKIATQRLDSKAPRNTQINKFMKPWGFYEVLLDGDLTKVKRLNIYPNTRLSYQFHNFRNEHWIIIAGEAEVKIDGEIKTLRQNESIYISKKSKHSVKNISNQNLILIEIQTGSYFGEDDIIRIDDPFKR